MVKVDNENKEGITDNKENIEDEKCNEDTIPVAITWFLITSLAAIYFVFPGVYFAAGIFFLRSRSISLFYRG